MKNWLPHHLTVTEAARQFGVPLSTLSRHVQIGNIKSIVWVGHHYLEPSDVAAWKRGRELRTHNKRVSPNWGEIYRFRMLDWNDQQIADELGISRERVRPMRSAMALRPVRNIGRRP